GGHINATAIPNLFSLGGFFNLSGLAPTSLFGPNYAITRAIYFRKIGRGGEGFFEFPAYIGMSLEAGNTWQSRGDMSFGSKRKDGALFPPFATLLRSGLPGFGLRHRGAQRVLSVPRPNFLALETATFAEFLDFLEDQCRLIADARIFMLARHVLEHPVAFRCGKKPMRLLPVGADEL